MVDVESALREGKLAGNIYGFDNMKLQGSEGLGTDKLISAINGTHFMDGSQANEQVLNWLPYSIGSLPPTIPKSFLADKSKNSDLAALDEIKKVAEGEGGGDVAEKVKEISKKAGTKTKVKGKNRGVASELGKSGQKVMDVTGELADMSGDEIPDISVLNPVLTDISGEAVDANIIYPAAYGSPDFVTDGWYWAASVATNKPGTYAYTMHIQLYQLGKEDGDWTWQPVDMTHEAYIKITDGPKINGFSGAGVCELPIP